SRRRHTRFKCAWSSDVCSSDLAPRLRFPGRAAHADLRSAADDAEQMLHLRARLAATPRAIDALHRRPKQPKNKHTGLATKTIKKIGRASCRERIYKKNKTV